jgi:hypothetical protein
MANDLSNVQQTSFEHFHQALANQPQNYAKLGRVIETDAANLQKGLVQGGAYFAEYTAAGQTSNVNQDVLSGKVIFASKAYAQTHKASFKELRDNPQLMSDIPLMLANNAGKSLNKLPFDGLCALNATNHPLAGSAINQVGTKKVFDTGLKYRQGVSGEEGTQSNLFTSPLSRASLDGDLQTLFGWRSLVSGIPLEMTPETSNLVLVSGASNRDLAMALRGSAVSGADMQVNTLAGMYEFCEAPLARAEDYYLIARAADFCGAWIRQYPQILIKESENGLDAIFTASFIANFWFNPEGAGAIAHIVG